MSGDYSKFSCDDREGTIHQLTQMSVGVMDSQNCPLGKNKYVPVPLENRLHQQGGLDILQVGLQAGMSAQLSTGRSLASLCPQSMYTSPSLHELLVSPEEVDIVRKSFSAKAAKRHHPPPGSSFCG